MGIEKHLESAGLLNVHTEDIGVISMGKRSHYNAFCDSLPCKGKHQGSKVLKAVDGEPDKCPDCGYYLIYKRKKPVS